MNTREPREGLIDLYLDGLLDEVDHRAFEERLPSERTLCAQVELQGWIDAALRQVFSPPDPNRVMPLRVGEATHRIRKSPTPARTLTGLRRYAVAAVLALGVVGVWRIGRFFNPPVARDVYAPQAWRSLETVYRDKLADGYKPDWVCKDDQEFQRAFQRRLGQRVLLAAAPAGITAGGLGYCNSITELTMYLLGRVEGREVIVFVDRAKFDSHPSLSPGSNLRLFRRELGDLVLYELSPLDHPALLDLLYIANGQQESGRWEP